MRKDFIKFQVVGDFDIYRNRIVNSANGSSPIARELTDVSYSITCYYERIHRLEYGYSVSGNPNLLGTNLINTGDYHVSFDFSKYTDDTFRNKVPPGANDIPLNQRTYFAVDIYPSTDGVGLESCWTTPSNDSNDPGRYNLINRCVLSFNRSVENRSLVHTRASCYSACEWGGGGSTRLKFWYVPRQNGKWGGSGAALA